MVVSEEGVKFRSYRDGSPLHLSPESSIDAQKQLGADIIIPLDELPAYRTGRTELERSVAMTHRWEARSLRRHLEERLTERAAAEEPAGLAAASAGGAAAYEPGRGEVICRHG